MSAKVSGLYPAVGPMDVWTADDVRPFVDDALELFGVDGLMVGSDWPVAVLAGGYDRVWDGVASIFAGFEPSERAALFGGTATAFYQLDPALLASARKDKP